METSSGRQGVVKHASGNGRRLKRFYDEALNMNRMNGTRGILPVWDIDDSQPDSPAWYAMPRAELLDRALGNDATLRAVVSHVAFLADVLTKLADQGIYHRDIKPANLFWYDKGPVLADFGIAAWGARSAAPGITRRTEGLGPANFIAPEMRYNRPADRGRKADVFSLAKTLFVLALPQRGPYPPGGTHRADSQESSLWETGGSTHVLAELRHVLEAATEFDPRTRLSMSDFRDELDAWLRRYPDEQFRPRGERPRLMYGWEALIGWRERDRRDEEQTRAVVVSCISRIAAALTGDSEAWNDAHDGEVLGDYAWDPGIDEDIVWMIWAATKISNGRRIIIEAVLQAGEGVCFLAESQTGGPPWILERQWSRTEWSRPRMPRTAEQVENLTREVIAWTANITGPAQV